MSVAAERLPEHRATLARIARGLRMVTVPLPHLSGLAAAVRVEIDERVPTMGVFASGRLVANPAFTARLSEDDLVFVLAHELLHLALRTHERAKGSGQLEFNYAHDYIINDTLRHALGVAAIPAGGLDMPGAREKSAGDRPRHAAQRPVHAVAQPGLGGARRHGRAGARRRQPGAGRLHGRRDGHGPRARNVPRRRG
jgi:hypothetical protein